MNRTFGLSLFAAAIALAATAGYWWGRQHTGATHEAATATASKAPTAVPATERKVLYWYDPMYPQQRFDKPGKSPFMDMQLVPKYADEAIGEGAVAVNSRMVQSLGIRTAVAQPGSLAPTLSAVGTVAYNERAVVLVQPRANGFIEKLYVRAPLDPVRAGDPLVEMLLPEWAAAQEEFLLLQRLATPEATALRSAARQRLTLLGMSEEQITAVEREGKVQTRVTLRAPVSGVIAELGAREGMNAMAGTTLFRIASLGAVWVIAEVPETQAAMVLPGSRVEVRIPAYPGEVFAGKVGAILPEVNTATRTVRARIEVANPAAKLKPGMFANLVFPSRAHQALTVPSEAVIRTGERNVVIVAEGEREFRAVEVEVGMEADGSTEIRKGLKAGERVVISGQFLIDSEASLRSTLARLGTDGAVTPGAPSGSDVHTVRGRVTGIDAAKGVVELDHAPIPALQWPQMTMPFAVEDRAQLAKLRKGDAVEFEMRGKPNAEGDYVIVRITASPPGTPTLTLPPQGGGKVDSNAPPATSVKPSITPQAGGKGGSEHADHGRPVPSTLPLPGGGQGGGDRRGKP